MKVIFRTEYDPYMKMQKYLAVFPDEKCYGNNLMSLSFYKNGNKYWFDNHAEISRGYYYGYTKTIKDKTKLKHLKEVVESYYNSMPGDKTELKVRMKIS